MEAVQMVGSVHSLVPAAVHSRPSYYMERPFRCQSHKGEFYLPTQTPISANNLDEVARWWRCKVYYVNNTVGMEVPVAITGNWLASPGTLVYNLIGHYRRLQFTPTLAPSIEFRIEGR